MQQEYLRLLEAGAQPEDPSAQLPQLSPSEASRRDLARSEPPKPKGKKKKKPRKKNSNKRHK